MNNSKLNHYQTFINKTIIYERNNQTLTLTVSEIINHPFYNKPAFKFYENDYAYLCEYCSLFENTLIEEKNILQQYLEQSIYYPNYQYTRELVTSLTPKVNNLFKVQAVFHNTLNNKYYFQVYNHKELKLAEDFTVYFDSKVHYYNFEHYKKIDEKEWLNMFNLFETGSSDILFYIMKSPKMALTCLVKGFALTQYEDKKWKLLPVLFNTNTNDYKINLPSKELKIIQKRETLKKILYRKFFFKIQEELLEFDNILTEEDLNDLSRQLKWSYENKSLHDKIEEKFKTKELVKKEKKKKI